MKLRSCLIVVMPLITFFLLLTGISAEAQNMTVLSCSKIGVSKKISGAKYVCQLKGKKLIYVRDQTATKVEIDLSKDPSITSKEMLGQTASCKISDISIPESDASSGFPRQFAAKQLYKILVIPISFTDLQFNLASQNAIKTAYEKANKLFNAVSYGRVTIQVTFAKQQDWQNFPGPVSNFIGSAGAWATSGNDFDNSELVRKVISDYSAKSSIAEYDTVDVSTANDMTYKILSEFAMPSGSSLQYSTKSTVSAVAHFGMIGRSWNVAHELGHALFGFEDLYDPTKNQSFLNGWDLMETSQGTSELMGWHRWLVSWIDDNQVRCIDRAGKTKHYLSALNLNNQQPKLIVIRKAAHSAIVVELRNRTEFDLVSQTLIVYVVDNSAQYGEGPVHIAGEMKSAGKSVSVRGTTISVSELTSTGALIEIQN